MQHVPLTDLKSLLIGQFGCIEHDAGLQPVRFDPATGFMLDPLNGFTAAMTSGVRLRLSTDSRSVRLSTLQTQAYLSEPEQWQRNFEVRINDEVFAQAAAVGGAFLTPGQAPQGDPHAVLNIGDLPAGEKTVEIWFPQSTVQIIQSLELDAGASWRAAPDSRPKVLFHGSSITHGMEADSGTGSWPAVASSLADVSVLNMGWAGSCLISSLAARTIAKSEIDALVLELGINIWDGGAMNPRTLADSTHAMLTLIRDEKPELPIVLLSPIASPSRETTGENGGMTLQEIRQVLEGVVEAHRNQHDLQLHYVSGLELFSTADSELLVDGLHPDAEGYRLIGERFNQLAMGFLLKR
ncbi:TPA: SGNH/GDSL hydrolase family protein [Pseudomonas aeruginosa]